MSTDGTPATPTGPAAGPPTAGQTPLDLRRTPVSMGSVVTGYGLTPASARQRAVVVRAVTDDSRIRQRPMPVVAVTGLAALGGLAVWGWQLWLAIDENQPLSLLFWAALATFLVAAAICSWAWQLYDAQKTIVMWLAIVVLGLAAVLVLLLVLVAIKGDGDLDLDFDLDGLLDKIGGSSAARDPVGFTDHVALPYVQDVAATMSVTRGPSVDGQMAAGTRRRAAEPAGCAGLPLMWRTGRAGRGPVRPVRRPGRVALQPVTSGGALGGSTGCTTRGASPRKARPWCTIASDR